MGQFFVSKGKPASLLRTWAALVTGVFIRNRLRPEWCPVALKAAFWSSGSVLHLVGFDGPAENFFRDALITELHLSEESFTRLLAFLASTFARADPSGAAEARPGLYPYSRFYDASGKFSILRSCNTWVAEALQSAGLPVEPSFVIIASNLNRELANLDEHE